MASERDKAVRLNELKYRKPLAIAKAYLRDVGIIPESPIWIYPVYPNGWYALVGSGNRVWIVYCLNKCIYLSAEARSGLYPDGRFRRSKQAFDDALKFIQNYT